MDKLQQEIMEIIEPYTDKTLSEGCLMQFTNNKRLGYIRFLGISEYLNHDHQMWFKYENSKEFKVFESTFGGTEILGHYDITAVLKYIRANSLGYSEDICENEIIYQTNGHTFKIPNKPLHLYSEQENESLLKLLKKLNEK